MIISACKRCTLRGNRVLYLRDGKILDECDLGKYAKEDNARKEKLIAFLREMGW